MLILIAMMAEGYCAIAQRKSQRDQDNRYGELPQLTDRQMARQYQAAMAEARREDAENKRDKANKPPIAAGVLASQRAWLHFRDAQCGMISDQWAGGTGYGQIDSRCRIDLNRRTASDLQKRASGTLNPPYP
jgi:uncharacterized protein YecT (DUF1311 family)